VFRVLVPAGNRAGVAIPVDIDRPANLLAGARILIVDDEADVRDGTARLLTQWGCVATPVANVDSARRAYANRDAPDVMIIDFRLGDGTDGLEAIAALRLAFGRAVATVLVSGESASDQLARIQASGVLLMHKPVPPARLRSLLAHLLLKRDEADSVLAR
jgi:two-component system, sensor histidine kinase